MDWTEIYRDAVTKPFVQPGQERQWGKLPAYALPPGTKPCRIIPCPGSYFPHHDDQCEMVWEEDDEGWGVFTECACEPRARAVRDAS